MRIETDPLGNFLGQGYEVGSGRDWARLGNLYLQDGVWRETHFCPKLCEIRERTSASLDGREFPDLRRLFLINGDGQYPIPRNSYYMAGAGGQTTLIVPSHDLVVMRLGHYRGEATGAAAFRNALHC